MLRGSPTRIRESGGLEAELIIEGWTPLQAELERLHLFRIVQESVNNAVKHADCGRLTVRFVENQAVRHVRVELTMKGTQ